MGELHHGGTDVGPGRPVCGLQLRGGSGVGPGVPSVSAVWGPWSAVHGFEVRGPRSARSVENRVHIDNQTCICMGEEEGELGTERGKVDG